MGEPVTAWVPPPRFEEFAVVRPLGRGGMGHVYLARDLALERPVALKFIAGEATEASRRRFLVEARALARLGHPNVVSVFRVGDLFGRPYIAYEFVPGRSLQQLERPVPWPMALRIASGLARGLAEAHRAGILHRDLKPANAVLSDAGAVKLIDFGLARLERDAASSTDPYLPRLGAPRSLDTRPGSVAGTPAYLAPEQWMGDPATPQSDVYSLGLVLYELLAGRSPHPPKATPEELAQAILSRDNAPVREVCPDVPESFARVVDRCLRREPAERYPSAGELARELADVQAVFLPQSGQSAPATLERDAVAVAASFAQLSPRLDAFGDRLYARLFESHPELRPLFPASVEGQREKLTHALRLSVEGLHEPERLIPALEDLGRRHRGYNVPPGGYDAFTSALVDTLRDFNVDSWSHSLEQHWTRAIRFITGNMERGQGLAASTQGSTSAARISTLPLTRWADADGVSIAYQEFGRGSRDIVLAFGWLTHVEMAWRHPSLAGFLRRLGKLGRVLFFDKRGVGLSDRGGPPPGFDERIADVEAVMDAVGSTRAVIVGVTQGAATCAAMAALRPQRVESAVFIASAASALSQPDYPFGMSRDALDARAEEVRRRWGEALFLEANAPSMAGDPAFRDWMGAAMRMSASPGYAGALLKSAAALDLRPLLPRIAVPSLVLQRAGDRVTTPAEARFLAGRIPGARYVEVPGEDHLPYTGDTAPLFEELERFLEALP